MLCVWCQNSRGCAWFEVRERHFLSCQWVASFLFLVLNVLNSTRQFAKWYISAACKFSRINKVQDGHPNFDFDVWKTLSALLDHGTRGASGQPGVNPKDLPKGHGSILLRSRAQVEGEQAAQDRHGGCQGDSLVLRFATGAPKVRSSIVTLSATSPILFRDPS